MTNYFLRFLMISTTVTQEYPNGLPTIACHDHSQFPRRDTYYKIVFQGDRNELHYRSNRNPQNSLSNHPTREVTCLWAKPSGNLRMRDRQHLISRSHHSVPLQNLCKNRKL